MRYCLYCLVVTAASKKHRIFEGFYLGFNLLYVSHIVEVAKPSFLPVVFQPALVTVPISFAMVIAKLAISGVFPIIPFSIGKCRVIPTASAACESGVADFHCGGRESRATG